jgi:citrate synthase
LNGREARPAGEEPQLNQLNQLNQLPAIRASAGIALLGTQVIVHGKDLHHDCLDLSFVHYFLFSVTGRSFDAERVRVLERLWISTGYPDARIWCNRIAGYLGSARVDPGLAMSAAIAASNSIGYGFRAMSLAYAVQAMIPDDLAAREAWLTQKLEEKRTLPGYGRPIHKHDERIAVALQILVRAGLFAGPALTRAFWLHRRLGEKKGIEINIAAVWAAISIDFGICQREYDAFMLLMFTPGHAAVYEDQRARPPMAFLSGHQTAE